MVSETQINELIHWANTTVGLTEDDRKKFKQKLFRDVVVYHVKQHRKYVIDYLIEDVNTLQEVTEIHFEEIHVTIQQDKVGLIFEWGCGPLGFHGTFDFAVYNVTNLHKMFADLDQFIEAQCNKAYGKFYEIFK